MLTSLFQDIRYTLRLTRKSPGFFACVILLLALGIGLNSAIFSLLDALLLRPLPVKEPQRLVRLVQVTAPLGARSYFTYQTYRALTAHTGSFSDVFGYSESNAAVRDANGAHRVRCHFVTGSFFTALGVRPLHGRILTPADELRASDALPVVLSYAYWMRRYGAAPSAIGQGLTLQNRAFTIVGVMPREFHGVQVETCPDLMIPLIAAEGFSTDPDYNSFHKLEYALLVRVHPGISLQAARAEAESIFKAAIEEQFHGSAEGSYWVNGQFQLQPIANGVSLLRPKFSSTLLVLMSGGALLLLIVCANIGGLLLARTAARRGEIAIRLAVGATGSQLIRQWLTETLLVTLAGGLLGLGAAWAAMPLLVLALPPVRNLEATLVTLSLDLKPDARLLAFSFLLCLCSALLAGLPAAVQATRHDLHTALRATRSTSRQPLRWLLVALQVALCTLLLSVAGLLVSTFRQLRSLDPGFDRDHVVTFSADTNILGYTAEQSHGLRSRLMAAVREMPGVVSAAVASRGLMRGTGVMITYAHAGHQAPSGEFLNTSMNLISPDYFETMGMRILTGRSFHAAESKATPEPVIVNRAFVQHFYPARDPIGQQFGEGWQHIAKATNQIVGVVSDAKYRSMREAMKPTAYHCWQPDDNVAFILHVRTRNDPKAIIEPVRRALRSIEPRVPIDEIHTLAEEVDASLWSERALAWLSAAFSAVAAALAALGIFGALTHAIAQSKREIGIRVALGALPADVVRMLSARPLMFAAIGVAAGVLAFFALAPAFAGVLYGVSATDPFPAAAAAIAVLSTALAASLGAALGALRVNPAVVLREE